MVTGVVALVFLLATPVGALEGFPAGQGLDHNLALSALRHGAVSGACAQAASCAESPVLPLDAGGAGAAGYQRNHTMAWSQVATPPTGFGAGGGLVANSSSGVAVAFGGVSSGALVNSTFTYTEATNRWSRVPTTVAPTPRSDFAFGLDPTTGTAVLFGGRTNATTLDVSNDTWVYRVSSAAWAPATHGPTPPAREAAAFAIDPSLGIGILYGGWDRNFSATGSLTYSDLWELNLSTDAWSAVNVSGPRPPPLEGAAMDWDPQTSGFEMMGGCYPCSSAVWQFDPVHLKWTDMPTPPTAPAARAAESWAYDPTVGADLLFGGTNGVTVFNDTYLFYPLNNTWVAQTVPSGPSARSNAASAFLDVPHNETWLLAGGQSGATSFSDLWRLSETANVSLRVVNASSPTSPLAGAEVNLSGRRIGATDGAGYFNLTQVDVVGPPLQITDDPWYYPTARSLWLPPGQATSLTVELSPEPLGVVHLLVNTSLDGWLVGVFANLTVDSVRINRLPAVTNDTGNASFYGVPPGRVNVTTELPQWRSAFVDGLLTPGGVLNTTVTMYYDPVIFITVLGRLPTVGSLFPLALAQVFLNQSLLGVTASDGTLTATTSAIGLVPLSSVAPGFFSSTQYLSVPFTGTASATLVLTSLPFGLLDVTVLRAHDNLPLAGASVTAVTMVPLTFGSYSQSNLTDNLGTAGLSLPEGEYLLTAAATGYISSAGLLENVSSGPNAPITIHLQIIPPANLSLVVVDRATGDHIAKANVTLLSVFIGHANDWGYYNATNISPGTYVLEVSAPRYFENATALTLSSAENRTMTVNLTLEPVYIVVGTGWGFNLFPGGLAQLWPFLLVPLLLVLGSFVVASVLRGSRDEEGGSWATGAVEPETEERDGGADRPVGPASGATPPSGAAPP